MSFLQWHSILSIAILAMALLYAGGTLDPQPRRPASLLVLAVILYPLGYLCLHVEPRFLSQVAVLLFLLGMFVLEAVCAGWAGPVRRALAMTALCGSFVLRPTHDLLQDRAAGREVREKADNLIGALPAGSRMASDSHWHESLFLAFHRGLAYYGEARPGASAAEVEADLKKHRIEFFVVWDDPGRFAFVQSWPEVSQGRVPGIKIYRVPA